MFVFPQNYCMSELQASVSFDCTLPKTIICYVDLNNLREKCRKTRDMQEVDQSIRK